MIITMRLLGSFRMRFSSWLVAVVLVASFPLIATAQQVSVPASFHRQEHRLSCEVATLKMALKVHGIEVPESKLIATLPFDRTPRGNGIWGDPNVGFVGNIDGRMLGDGYGVYWDPIATLAKQYGAASVLRHGSPSQLARAIAAGNPVIIWGYYGERAPYSWQTPAGTTIHTMAGEHTRLVYGFDGSVDSPTRFYLIDPISGLHNWSTNELMHNWSSFQHMGVIVAAGRQWVRVPGDMVVWEMDDKKNTRREILTWNAFISRGGSAATVTDIDNKNLLHYTIGEPIE